MSIIQERGEIYLDRRGVGGALDWHDPRKGLSGTVKLIEHKSYKYQSVC